TQAVLWTLVPSLFYASPPGDVPLVLAIGHEWQLGTAYGPPLAYWLAELAFRLAGGSVIGIYVLSQLCVVITFWAVFALGRSIAAILVALMAAFTVATERGRATLGTIHPYVAVAISLLIAFPYLYWLSGHFGPLSIDTEAASLASAIQWLRQLASIFIDHAGL